MTNTKELSLEPGKGREEKFQCSECYKYVPTWCKCCLATWTGIDKPGSRQGVTITCFNFSFQNPPEKKGTPVRHLCHGVETGNMEERTFLFLILLFHVSGKSFNFYRKMKAWLSWSFLVNSIQQLTPDEKGAHWKSFLPSSPSFYLWIGNRMVRVTAHCYQQREPQNFSHLFESVFLHTYFLGTNQGILSPSSAWATTAWALSSLLFSFMVKGLLPKQISLKWTSVYC